MSDKANVAAEEQGKHRRAPSDIDLPKSEIKDLTPKDEGLASGAPLEAEVAPPAIEAAPEGPSSSAETVSTKSAEAAEPAAPDVPEPAVVSAEKPAKSGRGGGMALGAVAGAITGVLGAFGMQSLLPPPARVADPRIPALESALGTAAKKIEASAPELGKLDAALKAAEAKLAALEQRPPQVPASVDQKLKGVDESLKGLDAGIAAVRAQAENAVRKLGEIEKLASAPPEPATKSAENATTPATVEAPRIDLAPIAARIVKLEEALADAGAKTLAGSEALKAVDGRIKGAEDQIAALKTPRAADLAPAVLAITSLARRRFDQGEPIHALVSALGALGLPADELKPLAVYGDKPVSTPASLVAQLSDLAAKVPKPAVAPTPPEMSVSDRLKANITALVEVRPVGAPRAVDAAGALALLRSTLLTGDVPGAIKALEALPSESKTVMNPVAEALARRNAALNAIGRIETAALLAAPRRN